MSSEISSAGKERFAALDGLRALASILVVFHHVRPGGAYLHVRPGGAYLDRRLGVNTLFAISGFLVTWLLLRERAKTGTIAAGRFHLRRAFRILPLYYVMLLVYIGATMLLERGTPAAADFWRNLPKFASFTASDVILHEGRVIFLFAWSLSTQERLYLVWPWIVRLAQGRAVAVLAIAGLLTLVPTPFIPPGQATAIWMGCFLGALYHHPRGAALVRRVAGGWWSMPLAVAGILLPLAVPSVPLAFTLVSLCYLVAACVVRPGFLEPILAHPWMLYVGKVSFGIYLMHVLCIEVVDWFLPGAPLMVAFALSLALSVFAASLSFRIFETPVRDLGMRLVSPRPRLPPDGPAPAVEPPPLAQGGVQGLAGV